VCSEVSKFQRVRTRGLCTIEDGQDGLARTFREKEDAGLFILRLVGHQIDRHGRPAVSSRQFKRSILRVNVRQALGRTGRGDKERRSDNRGSSIAGQSTNPSRPGVNLPSTQIRLDRRKTTSQLPAKRSLPAPAWEAGKSSTCPPGSPQSKIQGRGTGQNAGCHLPPPAP
jgi:hypothetical protein